MSVTINEVLNKNTSFSGGDIVASITLPSNISDGQPFVIGNLQTISYSIHREVEPVRTLGSSNPKAWTRGPRTIAGSMIFTIFNKNLVYELQKRVLAKLDEFLKAGNKLEIDTLMRNDFACFVIENLYKQHIVLDMMPPFDITINAKNEYGKEAYLKVLGIVVADEGQVMSVEDIIIENTVSFKAMDVKPMVSKVEEENGYYL